jgi:hypothetical protein
VAAFSVQNTSSKKESLTFLVRPHQVESDEDVLSRLQRFIIEGTTSPIRLQYESEASKNYSYIENDFYTDDELAEFAQRGQPPTKRNEIAPILENIAGQFIQTRQVATFLGRNTPADDPVGAMAQDYQRWNDQQNQFKYQEQDIAWDGLVGGVGWLKSSIKTNELGQKYECLRSVNPFHVYKDPRSVKYDPNEDAKYILEGSWMDIEDAISLFPGKEDAILAHAMSGPSLPTVGSSNVAASLQNEQHILSNMYALSFDGKGARCRVRPFEVWYKRKVKVYYVFRDDGVVALPIPLDSKQAKEVVKQLGEELTVEGIYQDRMYTGVVLGSLLLHHDVSEHQTNLFPYIPFYSGLKKNGAPLALTTRLVPINELVNKLESKATTLVTNRQTIAEKSAVEDIEKFQEEKARPDGYMEVRDGALSGGKVINTSNLEIGQGHMALLQEAKDALSRIGLPNASRGISSEVRSGRGIALQQKASYISASPLQSNLSRTRWMKARLSFDLMKQYLTEEMAFQITDDPNAPRTVQVSRGAIQAMKERLYDIVITEQKDYDTLREQQAEVLMPIIPQLSQMHPMWMKLVLSMTEWRDKEGLLKMVDEISQQGPAMPRISLSQDWKDLTPEMQAFYAMTAFKSQELAQAIMEKNDDPAFIKKLKADLIGTQIKEGTRAQVEKGRVDLTAMQTAIDGRIALRQQFLDSQQTMNQGAPSV